MFSVTMKLATNSLAGLQSKSSGLPNLKQEAVFYHLCSLGQSEHLVKIVIRRALPQSFCCGASSTHSYKLPS